MKLPWTNARRDKIFVNYRRTDAGGFAGRLSDTLTSHFGGERVFRDVTGIDYGADFEQVIDDRIAEACAIVVVIGEQWLSLAGEDGRPRLFDPEDYVAREIEAALKADVVVIPVLIGDAQMPRKEDLPERLAGLSMRNAIAVSDERWAFDVARLAKVLAIDVSGSVAQGKLDWMRSLALSGLLAAGVFATVAFSRASMLWASGAAGLRDAGFTPLASAIQFFAIVLAGTMSLMGAPLMEERGRKYAWAAVSIATVGTSGAFIHYALRNVEQPDASLALNFVVAMSVSIVMLAMVGLAGFREK